jgi:hypothetical protein
MLITRVFITRIFITFSKPVGVHKPFMLAYVIDDPF